MAKQLEVNRNNKNMGSSLSGLFQPPTPKVKPPKVEELAAVVEQKIVPSKRGKKRSLKADKPLEIKRTISVSPEHDSFIDNLVHTRRMEGKTDYLQKDAMAEIIAFFAAEHKNIKQKS
jgi:hypothetical protein